VYRQYVVQELEGHKAQVASTQPLKSIWGTSVLEVKMVSVQTKVLCFICSIVEYGFHKIVAQYWQPTISRLALQSAMWRFLAFKYSSV
jgi:hypothetical protein